MPIDIRAGKQLPLTSTEIRVDLKPMAHAVFDTVDASITYHRVPYDHEAAAAKVRAAGLPERLAERLIDGD